MFDVPLPPLPPLFSTSHPTFGDSSLVILGIHRSITFWSGLLIIAFLAWAWRDSERGWIIVSKGQFTAYHGCGGLALRSGSDPPSPSLEFRRSPVDEIYPYTPEIFAAPFFLRSQDVPEAVKDELPRRRGRDNLLGLDPEPYTIRELMTLGIIGNPSSPGGPARVWLLFIPHWIIILLTALITAALLIWRSRRRKRALTIPAPAP